MMYTVDEMKKTMNLETNSVVCTVGLWTITNLRRYSTLEVDEQTFDRLRPGMTVTVNVELAND